MKTLLLILTFIIIFAFPIYAKKTLILSFGQSCDVGEHQEIVFEGKRILSLLQWPMYPSFASHFSLDLSFKYFHLYTELALNYPVLTGYMKDSDYTEPSQQKKTLFSRHDAFLKRGILTSLSLGILLKIANKKQNEEKYLITLEPAFLFYFSHLKWQAKGGYTQYKSDDTSIFWNEFWPKTEYKGKGIEYTKNIFFIFLALNLCVNIKNKWFIGLNSAISPFLIGKSCDIHFDSDTLYLDTFLSPAISMKEELFFEYRINRFSFSLRTAFLFSYANLGDTKTIKYSKGEYIESFGKGSSGTLSKIGRFTVSLRTWF